MVLVGNAAHSAHYSIGSGTRLALDDAAELSRVLTLDTLPVPEALAAYEANRKAAAAHLHDAASPARIFAPSSWREKMRLQASTLSSSPQRSKPSARQTVSAHSTTKVE
jgi:anthraniloyl-CoA monooxygenase